MADPLSEENDVPRSGGEEGESVMDMVPDEVLVGIVEYCGLWALGTLAQVSQRFKRIAEDPVVRALLFKAADIRGEKAASGNLKFKIQRRAALRDCSLSLSRRLAMEMRVFEDGIWEQGWKCLGARFLLDYEKAKLPVWSQTATWTEDRYRTHRVVRADPTTPVEINTRSVRLLLSEAVQLGIRMGRLFADMFTDVVLEQEFGVVHSHCPEEGSAMYDSLYIHRGEGLIPPPSDFRVKCCFLDFAIATGNRSLVETFVDYGAYPRGADNDYFEFNPMLFFPDPSAESRLDEAVANDGVVDVRLLDLDDTRRLGRLLDLEEPYDGEVTPKMIRLCDLRGINPTSVVLNTTARTSRLQIGEHALHAIVTGYGDVGRIDEVCWTLEKYGDQVIEERHTWRLRDEGRVATIEMVRRLLADWAQRLNPGFGGGADGPS